MQTIPWLASSRLIASFNDDASTAKLLQRSDIGGEAILEEFAHQIMMNHQVKLSEFAHFLLQENLQAALHLSAEPRGRCVLRDNPTILRPLRPAFSGTELGTAGLPGAQAAVG